MHDEPDAGLGALFEDLEQQAAAMELAERDAELADRAQGEYAGVTLESRFHASRGQGVLLSLTGAETVTGTLAEVGAGWCAVTSTSGTGAEVRWVVRLAEVAHARGLSSRSVPEAARPAVARLGFGSALRRIGGESAELTVHPVAGPALTVRVLRVGADFAEVVPSDGPGVGRPLLVAFGGIRAVRSG
ncbi:MAG TPA: hypothetical protein VFZ64_11115 [Nocardioidaceae bacterium]